VMLFVTTAPTVLSMKALILIVLFFMKMKVIVRRNRAAFAVPVPLEREPTIVMNRVIGKTCLNGKMMASVTMALRIPNMTRLISLVLRSITMEAIVTRLGLVVVKVWSMIV